MNQPPEESRHAPVQCIGVRTARDWMPSALLMAALSCLGCTDQEAGIVTDMHHESGHDHEHQHSGHEQSHDGGSHGSHSHQHPHGHDHAKPLYGGSIISIGHTHHEGGITQFHAEIMPLTDGIIRFHILTDSADGGLQTCPVEVKEITALVSITGQELTASEQTFSAGGDGEATSESEFHLEIPAAIADADEYSIVIPALKTGGHRQNFSFNVKRSSTGRIPSTPPDSRAETDE